MLIAQPRRMTMMIKIFNADDDTFDNGDDKYDNNYRFTWSKAVLDITLEDHLEVMTQL